MSGHSKWASIKRQKGVADAKRGAIFTKLAREIMVAARDGGGDPSVNFRLRLAIDKARTNNMPTDNIDRAIKKGTGEGEATQVDELTFEAYGPHGVALLLEVMTDNRNRSVAEIRSVLTRSGGSLAETGAVAWQFDSKGVITAEASGLDAEAVFLTAADSGADDVESTDGTIEIYTPPDRLEAVRSALEAENVPIASAELSLIPKVTVALNDKPARQVLKLLEMLDDLDDVHRVSSNADFPEDVIAEYRT